MSKVVPTAAMSEKTLIEWVGGMPLPKKDETHYHAQLGLPDKVHSIKGLVVWKGWDL